jgi:hypothetical protein
MKFMWRVRCQWPETVFCSLARLAPHLSWAEGQRGADTPVAGATPARRGPRHAFPPKLVRAAPPPWRPVQYASEPRLAIERTPDIHLHLHGVSAEDVAAIIREQQPAARPAIEED